MVSLFVNGRLPGSTGVHVEGPFPELNLFLAQDLLLPSNVRDLITELRGVVAGTITPELSNGNAWEVMPGREVTVVQCSFGEPPTRYEVPTQELIEVLEPWLDYIEERTGLHSDAPTDPSAADRMN